MGSRDLRRVYAIEVKEWKVTSDIPAPGTPWAAVSTGPELVFTIGEGQDDDRYIRRFVPSRGFSDSDRIPCPEFTGSYLSYDGENLFLSQWYNRRILQLDTQGQIVRAIDVAAEISGHVFVNGWIYVLRGTEQNGEDWSLARLNPREIAPQLEDLAKVPFACRSLVFDGTNFWTNHRAENAIVSFTLR